jgi:hypothetical protein
MGNVIQQYYSGFIKDEDLLNAIEDSVREWQESDSDLDLHVFLGMCFVEYALWVQEPNKFVAQMHHQSYHPKIWETMD